MAYLVINPSSVTPPVVGADADAVLGIRIETTDDVLDRVAEQIEQVAAGERTGFWIAGPYARYRNGEATYPDPASGHQRLWIPVGATVHLYFDRPMSADPDRLEGRNDTVYL